MHEHKLKMVFREVVNSFSKFSLVISDILVTKSSEQERCTGHHCCGNNAAWSLPHRTDLAPDTCSYPE